MGTTTLILTPLPRSLSDGGRVTTLELSAFVSPRLFTSSGNPGVLGDFGAFHVPWPTTVGSLAFEVELLDASSLTGPSYRARVTNAGDEALDSELWSQLFPSTTPVTSFGYPSFTGDTLQSFPVGQVLGFIDALYGGVVVSDPLFPHDIVEQDLLYRVVGRIRHFAELHPNEAPGQIVDRIVDEVPRLRDGTQVGPVWRDELEALVAAYQFFAPNRGTTPSHATPAPIVPPDPDFHQMVALLGDAPVLLRRLGLVVDLAIDMSPAVVPSSGLVRIHAVPREVQVERPLVHFITRRSTEPLGPTFMSASHTGDLVNGHVDLRRDDVHLFQMDVDGSVIKVLNHAANVYQHSEAFPSHFQRAPDLDSTLPARYSVGLAVARDARAARIEDAWFAQDTINAEIEGGDLSNVPLFQEDLLRGFRVDVHDGSRWRTVCARVVEYVAGGTTSLGPFDDEGYVKRASMTEDSQDASRHNLHERMFEWSGWSLVADRPGLVLDPDEQLRDVPNTPTTALDLQTNVAPKPGSLPMLRFGETYRVKARTVDLAGNSVALFGPGGDATSTEAWTYRRLEPLPEPTLVYRDPLTEGEWIGNLVIRSDRDITVSAWSASNGYNETSERHVAPPKAHLFQCEQHGVFDDLWSTDASTHAASYAKAAKEGGTFLDEQVWSSKTEAYVPVTRSFWAHPATPIADPRTNRGDPLGHGVYVTHPDEQAVLPYLPEPAALGAVLSNPSTGATWAKPYVAEADYEATWPELPPFRLVCTEGSFTSPAVSVTAAGIVVQLPQATIYELELSSELLPARRDHFQVWHDVQGDKAARTAATQDLHAMLTPRRRVTFVHAVQRPLEETTTTIIADTHRNEGQNHSVLRGSIGVHGRSTSQIDVLAVWSDVIDDVNDPDGPRVIARDVHVGAVEVAYVQTTVLLPGADENVELTSRPVVRHEHGDTKHRWVKYYGKATTRYREYFPEVVWRDEANITVVEDVTTQVHLDVLSTARPVAPAVRMIVPGLRWERSRDGRTLTRHGDLLRVYLDRPWFTTGEDEQLGVIFGRRGGDVRTEWGADPGRRRDDPTDRMTVADVTNAATLLTAPDAAGTEVDVLLFDVQYDAEQRLHFVDVEIASGDAYTPFVRLVVARVQTHSVVDGTLDLRVSEEVRTEWVQPVPLRVGSVSRSGPDDVRVSLTGPASGERRAGANPAGRHMVYAQLETNPQGVSDLAWELAQPPSVLFSGTQRDGTIWSGTASVQGAAPGGPGLPRGGGQTWRLSIYEVELYPSDEDTAGPVSGFVAPMAPAGDRADYELDAGASGRVVTVLHLPIPL